MTLLKSIFLKLLPRGTETLDLARARVLRSILPGDEFLSEIARERDRSDRSCRPFCLLTFEARRGSEHAGRLADSLQRRLRSIDRPGWLRDKLCVLLPETPASGAWKLVEEIRGDAAGGPPLECSIFNYPCADDGGNLTKLVSTSKKNLSIY